ncbi:aquaporin 12 isoform X2 [Cynoglossus semilaevis]|uniref:aquaporin 12 isoform X2 n=1 Tax=Cynoglossus semilaevis TaxID=244447 RepID=UPI0004950094|nr:aquaporin-12-like isoform X2 [Cynoglossus semilaevis]
MSGLNASLGYFLAVVVFAATARTLLLKWPKFSFMMEFASSFMLVACWLELQTIVEVGEWAGGLGMDVTLTMLFDILLLSQGIICGGASGNPTVVAAKFLQLEATTLPTLLAVLCQFFGAFVALYVAVYYWNLELTDMHMIKNLMARECSTSLMVSLLQGFFTEFVCALSFHLIHLNLQRRSALIQVPLVAVLLTFLSHSARGYTSAYINPSLAYGLTFHCPGFTLAQYALVYWLGPLTGMALALLLYMGHIPRLFARNLFYLQKTRFKVPKGDKGEKKKM